MRQAQKHHLQSTDKRNFEAQRVTVGTVEKQ